MNNERAQEILAYPAYPEKSSQVREINTHACDPEELREDFEKFIKRFTEEGANLRCELVTGAEGVRFVAVFNWDDMG